MEREQETVNTKDLPAVNPTGGQTMRELPQAERPYEKCESLGPEALTDAELLAVILRTGSRGETSLKLAERILSACRPGKQCQ